MSTKWLVIWLIGFLIIAGVVGYFSLSLKKEQQVKQEAQYFEAVKENLSAQAFDYTQTELPARFWQKPGMRMAI